MSRDDLDALIAAWFEARRTYLDAWLHRGRRFTDPEVLAAAVAFYGAEYPIVAELDERWFQWGEWMMGVVNGKLFAHPAWSPS